MDLFNDILKKERKRIGLTQAQLGEKLGVTQQAIAKWEKGVAEPDISSIGKLADLFQRTPNFLLGMSEYSAPPAVDKEVTTLKEALECQGITNPEYVEMIERLVDLMAKDENNAEIAEEFFEGGNNMKVGE